MVFLSSRWSDRYPSFHKKHISKFDLPLNFGSQGRSRQSRSYWISFDSQPRDKHFGTLVPMPFVYYRVFKSYGQTSNFPMHRVALSWVQNWPDPRSLKWKMRNIHYVSNHSNISSLQVQNIRTKTVPTARSWSLKSVPGVHIWLHLTW